jgi:hypothetical protein
MQGKEIAFFGKITAGFTHEMKNVLAIIRESAGLTEDLLSLSPEAQETHREKIQKALGTVQNQVQRGVELTDRLNRFAHTPDHPTARIDLREALEHLTALAQRFARLKQVLLRYAPPADPIRLETRPLELQMALFQGVACCLDLLPADSEIQAYPRPAEKGAAVEFRCRGDLPGAGNFAEGITDSANWTVLQENAALLGGRVTVDGATRSITLFMTDLSGIS